MAMDLVNRIHPSTGVQGSQKGKSEAWAKRREFAFLSASGLDSDRCHTAVTRS